MLSKELMETVKVGGILAVSLIVIGIIACIMIKLFINTRHEQSMKNLEKLIQEELNEERLRNVHLDHNIREIPSGWMLNVEIRCDTKKNKTYKEKDFSRSV